MAQLGIGDPTQGIATRLSSITAVVLGGASLFGGRGSFVGALLGAALIQQITQRDHLPEPLAGLAVLVGRAARPAGRRRLQRRRRQAGRRA